MDKDTKKAKKAFKKGLKRARRPFKFLAVLNGILSVVCIIALVIVSMFDNTMAAFVGGNFWDLKNEDKDAIYYSLDEDFGTNEKLLEYGLEVCKQVEGEGAALLMNNNKALPLPKGSKVSLFSSSSVNLVYGGTGSGNIDASKADNLGTALKKAGIEYNPVLWDFYTNGAGKKYQRAKASTIATASSTTTEVPWAEYTQEVLDSVKNYSDAAVIVLSRIGGEGADLDAVNFNYLALDKIEKEMMANVAAMKRSGTVKKIVVLINSANALQVDFLKNNDYDVDAVLWIGDVGITGVNAVADILAGTINPSGCLVDTYCYNNFSAPAMANLIPVQYDGYKKGIIPDTADTYLIYQEGIYVGYKYYETRYMDMVMERGNTKGYDYSADVAFPFGYGLSYTTFEFSNMNMAYDKDSHIMKIDVTVKNTGDMAGKKTVQVYVSSPYTDYDRENNVEKAGVQLCGFKKTKLLQPGEKEKLTIEVDMRDVASYDAYGYGTYILEAGVYTFTVANDAHDAANNILAAQMKSSGAQSANIFDRLTEAIATLIDVPTVNPSLMDAEGNRWLTDMWICDKTDTTSFATSVTGYKIENQLNDSDPNLYPGVQETVTFLTRDDWKGTLPTGQLKIKLTEKLIEDLQIIQYDPSEYPAETMPVLGAKNGVKLYDLMGKDFNDPLWDKLLDQMTFDEMVTLIGDAFHWTMPVASVQSPGTRDENGPQGLTASLIQSDKTKIKATAFTSEDVMAATFNTELMTEIGRVIGNNCVAADISCLYGPGNNLHRTPYGGRNFEYYSEDGFLSGKMSAYEVAAIEKKGVQVVMKHFALNDCEADRLGLGVWLTEQAAREVYLKAFEDVVEEGNAGGVMTAYTRFGCIWSGGNYNLMTNILRNEWGCDGKLITDNILTQYVNGVDGIMAGVTIFDAMLPYITNLLPKYKDDAVVVNRMREACHYNLYAVVNSVGMNGVGPDTVVKVHELGLVTKIRGFMILFIILWAVCGFISARKTRAYKKAVTK